MAAPDWSSQGSNGAYTGCHWERQESKQRTNLFTCVPPVRTAIISLIRACRHRPQNVQYCNSVRQTFGCDHFLSNSAPALATIVFPDSTNIIIVCLTWRLSEIIIQSARNMLKLIAFSMSFSCICLDLYLAVYLCALKNWGHVNFKRLEAELIKWSIHPKHNCKNL